MISCGMESRNLFKVFKPLISVCSIWNDFFLCFVVVVVIVVLFIFVLSFEIK